MSVRIQQYMRALASVQSGTAAALDKTKFAKRVAEFTIRTVVPSTLLAAAAMPGNAANKDSLIKAAEYCATEGTAAAAAEAVQVALAVWAARVADTADGVVGVAPEVVEAALAALVAESTARAARTAARAAKTAARATRAVEASAEAAAWAAELAGDKILNTFSEGIAQVLVDLRVPGCFSSKGVTCQSAST